MIYLWKSAFLIMSCFYFKDRVFSSFTQRTDFAYVLPAGEGDNVLAYCVHAHFISDVSRISPGPEDIFE